MRARILMFRVGQAACHVLASTLQKSLFSAAILSERINRMANRIDRCFSDLSARGEKAFIAYICAGDPTLALTVERLEDGEVSPYLTDELGPGDELELRGPIGGYFVWRSHDGGPLLLVAGGSGLVPLMAMVRHRAAHSSTLDTRLLLSARSSDDVLYRDELARLAAGDELAVHQTFTREPPAGWSGFARRVDADVLSHVGPAPSQRPRIFICGPTAFVERAADLLVGLGHDTAAIHLERFGPTGG